MKGDGQGVLTRKIYWPQVSVIYDKTNSMHVCRDASTKHWTYLVSCVHSAVLVIPTNKLKITVTQPKQKYEENVLTLPFYKCYVSWIVLSNNIPKYRRDIHIIHDWVLCNSTNEIVILIVNSYPGRSHDERFLLHILNDFWSLNIVHVVHLKNTNVKQRLPHITRARSHIT